MDPTILLANIILSMREYQEKECIKNKCVTNSQYLYNFIKKISSSTNVTVKAVIVLSHDKELDTTTCVGGHLVVILDDNTEEETIIDASYDVFSLKNKLYFDNIKDFMHILKKEDKYLFKKSICDFIEFIKIADKINNGELLNSDKQFYNNQRDYIEKLYNLNGLYN